MINSVEEAKKMIEEGFKLAGYYPEYLPDTNNENAWIIPVNHQTSIRAHLSVTEGKYYDFRIYRLLLDLGSRGMTPETSRKLYEIMLNCYHHRGIRCSLHNNALWVSVFVTLDYENPVTLKNTLIDFIKAYGFYEKALAGLFGDADFNR